MSTSLDNDSPRLTRITVASDENQFIDLDAALTMKHTNSAQATSDPVELGADTTDNIRRLPKEYTLTGVISDHPIIENASDVVDARSRSILANEFLDSIIDRGLLINIRTRLRNYRNYAILSKTVEENSSTGRVVEFTIGIREIIIARTEQVDAPIPVAQAVNAPNRRKKRRRGRQNKKEELSEKNKEKSRSVASKLFGDGASSIFSGGPG